MCCVVLRMDTGPGHYSPQIPLKSGNQLKDNIEERKELRIMIAIPRIVLFVWWRCGDQELRAGRERGQQSAAVSYLAALLPC